MGATDSLTRIFGVPGKAASAVRRAPDRTVGLYMIQLQDGERSFSYWRSASAARRLAEGLEACPALSPGDILFFSGITMSVGGIFGFRMEAKDVPEQITIRQGDFFGVTQNGER